MKKEPRTDSDTVIHKLVAAAREGREPRVFARLFSGWAVFGEQQFLRGYALLLPDPVVPTLNALGQHERAAYLQDVARLGDAVLKVTGAARINYAILGNQEPALHTHVIPRYADEPEKLRTSHPSIRRASDTSSASVASSSTTRTRTGLPSARRRSALPGPGDVAFIAVIVPPSRRVFSTHCALAVRSL